jgi:hypothetical protein
MYQAQLCICISKTKSDLANLIFLLVGLLLLCFSRTCISSPSVLALIYAINRSTESFLAVYIKRCRARALRLSHQVSAGSHTRTHYIYISRSILCLSLYLTLSHDIQITCLYAIHGALCVIGYRRASQTVCRL